MNFNLTFKSHSKMNISTCYSLHVVLIKNGRGRKPYSYEYTSGTWNLCTSL